MKKKCFKRVLIMSLTTTMLMANVLITEAASHGSSGSSGSAGTSSSSKEESTDTVEESVSAPEESANVAKVVENVVEVSAGSSVNVGGTAVKSTIAGVSTVKSLQGVAVTTSAAELNASLGLKNGQTAFVMSFDTNAKKSPLAMNCINAAIESTGGSFVTAINVELGAKENGKFVSLKNGNAAMSVGLPKNVDTTKTFYVVCVQPGGAITILKDQDTNPKTVTFEIKAGLGTYALVSK